MQSGDSDARLMLAYRAGDESALSDLYGRWAPPLVRFLERMVRERAVAEELMQETFIRVHGARDRYAAEARSVNWPSWRIGPNRSMSRWRFFVSTPMATKSKRSKVLLKMEN